MTTKQANERVEQSNGYERETAVGSLMGHLGAICVGIAGACALLGLIGVVATGSFFGMPLAF